MKRRIVFAGVLVTLVLGSLSWLAPLTHAVPTAQCIANTPPELAILPTGVITDSIELGVCSIEQVIVNDVEATSVDELRWNYTARVPEGPASIVSGVQQVDAEVQFLDQGGAELNFQGIRVTTGDFEVATVAYLTTTRAIVGTHGWGYETSGNQLARWDWTNKTWAPSDSIPWEGPWQLLSISIEAPTATPTATATAVPTGTPITTPTSTPLPTATPIPSTQCADAPFTPFAYATPEAKTLGLCGVTEVFVDGTSLEITQDPSGDYEGIVQLPGSEAKITLVGAEGNRVIVDFQYVEAEEPTYVGHLGFKINTPISVLAYNQELYVVRGYDYETLYDWSRFELVFWDGVYWTTDPTWDETTVLRLQADTFLPLVIR